MTIHLEGFWAGVALGWACLAACIPVWIAATLVRDRAVGRIEASFRRRMAALGCTPAEIDEAWTDIRDPAGGATTQDTGDEAKAAWEQVGIQARLRSPSSFASHDRSWLTSGPHALADVLAAIGEARELRSHTGPIDTEAAPVEEATP